MSSTLKIPAAHLVRQDTGRLTDDERRTVERAAELLDGYIDLIKEQVKAEDLQYHPYLPEIELTAEALRDLIGLKSEPMSFAEAHLLLPHGDHHAA